MKKELYLIGINYKTAPVEVRERFALTDPALAENDVVPLENGISECMVLSTCNRVELLAVGDDDAVPDRLLEAWANAREETVDGLRPYLYTHKGPDAVRHLFSVASSLDSMVLGEPQILGQLKDAYRTTLQKQQARVILNRLLHKAFSVAKRVRTETAVASSAVSISYAAVELAKRIFEDMSGTHAMLIGAGEMAELAATHLVNTGIASVRVCNRTFERAVQLAEQFHGEAVSFGDLAEHLAKVDIVISSTGAHEPIIRAKEMREVLKKRKNKPMFFIDIAVPRDIDPEVNSLDNIYLYDIDDLKEVVEENLATRKEEASRARVIVDEETDVFCSWLRSLDLQPTIVDLLRRGERIAREELNRTMKRLGPMPEGSQEILESMLASILKKYSHEPITYLKRRCAEYGESNREENKKKQISLIRRIFNLDEEQVPENPHRGRR